MSSIRNKQRLLHLYRYLMDNTDEEHQVTTNDLVEYLKDEDANASRKTVKDDIEVLIKEGIDIVTTKSYYNSYFIGSRTFEIPEIKFMVDGIAANVSLSPDKKRKMIQKLLSMLSIYQVEKLRRNIRYSGDHGVASEQLYYSIDRISEAVEDHRKIEFQCCAYTFAGDKPVLSNGPVTVLTPVLITSCNNRYYMLGYDGKSNMMIPVRVDRMLRTRVLEDESDILPDDIDVDGIVEHLFEMDMGNMTEVVLECDNDMMDIIADRFGAGADIWKSTVDRFYVKVAVIVSPAFYSWVFRYTGRVKITSPVSVYNGYMEMLRGAVRRERNKK